MARPSRHEETVATIKQIARQQMAVKGAAALSLGAIARAMGLTTPALYRYFANRNALVTELILDAYRGLSRETEAAVEGIDSDEHAVRFRTLLVTYRRWALKHPQDYVLVHGAVLPGYEAPVEQVALAAFGGLRLLVSVLAGADEAGLLRTPPAYRNIPPRIREALELLEGANLAEIIDHTGALTPAKAHHVCTQILRSLREAHESFTEHVLCVDVLHEDLA